MDSDNKAAESRSESWKAHWETTVLQDNQFATMGRSSYTISDYFVYLADTVSGLGGVNTDDVMLDAAGGCGYLSMYYSPLVRTIDLFDYSEAAINRAKQECQSFSNITAYVDNLLNLTETRKRDRLYSKILVGSPLAYFDNYDEIELILRNLFDVAQEGCRIFIAHTPDLTKRDAHIASYDALDWDEERKSRAIHQELNDRLWIEYNEVERLAQAIGFSDCAETPIHSSLRQSKHMFDFYLVK